MPISALPLGSLDGMHPRASIRDPAREALAARRRGRRGPGGRLWLGLAGRCAVRGRLLLTFAVTGGFQGSRPRHSRKSKRQKYCKLKQQIQLRSLSDSCSSSHPGQLMMDPESSEVDKHIWSLEEELFVLQPFATDFGAEQERYKYDKTDYCQTAAYNLNKHFEKRISGWVPMTFDKVKRKFRAFGEKYKAYLSGKGYRGPPETPNMECYLRVELYIALYGGAFIEPLTSSRSRSSSRTPSESSVGPSSVKRIRRTKKEEKEITAAGKIMSAYQCDQVTWVWYLRALEDEAIRRGFWITADTEKKTYLDELLPMVKSEYYLKRGLKDPFE